MSSAAASWSRAWSSSVLSSLHTAARISRGNSRPIAAAAWATGFTGARWSSRAVSESCRDAGIASGAGRAGQLPPVDLVRELAALQHRLGELLQEQRHAVGLGDDLVKHRSRQCSAPREALDHGNAVARAEPVEGQHRRLRVVRPRPARTRAGTSRPATRAAAGSDRRRDRTAPGCSDRANARPRAASAPAARAARQASCWSQISCSLALRPWGPS